MSQERAARTRRALITAAAAEFARNGYAGTSLARVCSAAGVTMGALTFHFPSKTTLAAAVGARGADLTHEALRTVTAHPARGVGALVELTATLARLLEEDVVARAAARLGRERADTGAGSWHAAWMPQVRELVTGAADDVEGYGDPADLELLALYLVAGAEAAVQTGWRGEGTEEQVRRLWKLLLGGFGSRPSPA
ncbi:TetR/AcrR family transcriptional regulator [Streptomyces sp. JHA26]|uniref:TetR/AcrR family transcriptional regulator n=1 Tax=Streptomyces sp. JHA26 TaxID=1917143 RepID=UPI00098AE5D3|nr:TetR/AcrR family transcriptional regulator [Streptomyces sp. JHA26]